VRAVAAGKQVAASIDQYLRGEALVGLSEPMTVLMEGLADSELAEFFRGIERMDRTVMPELPLAARRGTFNEVELGFGEAEAEREARRCLRCGCSKASDCRLRHHATQYGAAPARYAGGRRLFRRDLSDPELVFEPGKCILCGACVQVAADGGEALGLTMVGRGFNVSVATPFNEPILSGLRGAGRRAAEVCPTGALVLRRQSGRGGNGG